MTRDVFIRIPFRDSRHSYVLCLSTRQGYYIHIGVGFEVAYLSELGKFDGLESEISSKYGSHAFLYYVVTIR